MNMVDEFSLQHYTERKEGRKGKERKGKERKEQKGKERKGKDQRLSPDETHQIEPFHKLLFQARRTQAAAPQLVLEQSHCDTTTVLFDKMWFKCPDIGYLFTYLSGYWVLLLLRCWDIGYWALAASGYWLLPHSI